MKEDKENARPKDRRLELNCDDGEKTERSKEKKEAMTKIVIRRLPPSLTKEELEEQLQPLPEMDYLEFFSNDTSLFPHLFARAYINFKHQEDIVLFRDRFDGYVFIDSRGQEYTAVVEFAPFQKTAKKRSKKKDAKCGTIAEDPDYNKFLEIYNGDDDKMASTPETLLEEIEAKSKELVAKKTTPLLDFLKNKQRIREEKKEERRRRELERKRVRDEERRKWREEERRKRKDTDKMKRLDKPLEKDKDQVKEEPKIKLLKKPDRAEDADSEKPKEKTKNQRGPIKRTDPWGVLIIRGVSTLIIRRIEEGKVRKTGGRSSGSATQTETESAMESGKRSAARGRRSASDDRTKTAGEGESARTLSGRRKGRMRLKKIKSGPLRRRREITLESPVALRGQRGLPKTTRRRRA
ncbi:Regulator of nonsense transcripts 3B [Dissostichus eleginoides]|uniref:Regulator of nonsense transcripts 3B n=1 Tax=Dissostichus eleginoides TaxID=100907 RepID=A0AAD9CL71_DISEL|nr:Regulator of nonsense transcripts 3B [Dissostichus eleginoides]